MNILLIEDEKITRITLTNTLRKEGFEVVGCATGAEGMEKLQQKAFDLVLTDLRLPKMNGIDILKYIKENKPQTFVIIMTAYASVETAVEALKIGAYDYLTKPFAPEKLIAMLKHIERFHQLVGENKKLKEKLRSTEKHIIVGASAATKKLIETVKVIAKNDYTVLIEGESGTGKEVIARALHHYSLRHNGPFVPINCAVIPETLIESELFGYEKGAFTGANKRHAGYFERANGGTLFLDDIDDLPLLIQVKLLRVLQEKEFTPVGGNKSQAVDLRVIGATKVNLKEKVQKNEFREDLYYRLNIIPIKLFPLRERKEDIPPLVEHFLQKHGAEAGRQYITKELLEKMMNYSWPGNVRELENTVERLIALYDLGTFEEQFLRTIDEKTEPFSAAIPRQEKSYPSFQQYIRDREHEIIVWAMRKAGNNISKAAELLRIPRSTLRSKMEKLALLARETES